MLSQARLGALDFMTLSPLILGTLVPAAQISDVGFAFKDYSQICADMDGVLGADADRHGLAARRCAHALVVLWTNRG